MNASVRRRVPPEIKIELSTAPDGLRSRISQVVSGVAAKAKADGDATQWLANLQRYLAGGEAMIVQARTGRTLVGFLVLDADKGIAPFSWVDQRFRNQGLGERFYSFACINLARTAPEFKFHKDMLSEYDGVLKSAGLRPTLQDSFYVVDEDKPETALAPPAEEARSASAALASASHGGKSGEGAAARRLVIDDGHWVGFSHDNARRLKLRIGRFPRLVEN
jgi:hypothetical protein